MLPFAYGTLRQASSCTVSCFNLPFFVSTGILFESQESFLVVKMELLHILIALSMRYDHNINRSGILLIGFSPGTWSRTHSAYRLDSTTDKFTQSRLKTLLLTWGYLSAPKYISQTSSLMVRLSISLMITISIGINTFSGTYATLSILPAPKALPDTAERSDVRVRCRALKFMKRGSWLIATYLNHGIV